MSRHPVLVIIGVLVAIGIVWGLVDAMGPTMSGHQFWEITRGWAVIFMLGWLLEIGQDIRNLLKKLLDEMEGRRR